ncbi:MAG: penicillin-binding protein 2, partial [Candidatus Omnitrophica bacterium]|nr:penicillin-binding protein 2 [Candidatus Omnitrophota bacterium]
MRLKIFSITIAFLFFILFLGLVYIQLIRGRSYYELSENNHIRLIELDALRGTIFDRNGVVLADNKLTFDVAIVPQEFQDKNLPRLSKLLDTEVDLIRKKIKSGYTAPFAPVVVAKNIKKTQAILIEQQEFNLPGVVVQIKPQRYYPQRTAGAHVLGYVGMIDRSKITKLKNYGYKISDIVGYSGVEEYYDAYLRGEDGGIQVEVDNRGRQLRVLGIRPSVKGKNMTLTIDARIQKIAADLLADNRGAIIVMQPETGEVLALVSSPSFDPNHFTIEHSQKNINDLLNNYRSPMLNRAINAAFPPGSVFKIITTLAALGTKKASIHTSFICQGSFSVGSRSFACWSTHGIQDLLQAITHSCNVCFYNLGLLVGPDILTKYAKEAKLAEKTQIDLPYEEKGNIPDRNQRKLTKKQDWYKGDTANFAIGQGEVLATPIQTVRLIAAIANSGELSQPYVAKYIENKQINTTKFIGQLPFNKSDLDFLKMALRNVV